MIEYISSSQKKEQESENTYYRPSSLILQQNERPPLTTPEAGSKPEQNNKFSNIYEIAPDTTYSTIPEQQKYTKQLESDDKQQQRRPPSITVHSADNNKTEPVTVEPGNQRYQILPDGTFERDNGYTKIRKENSENEPYKKGDGIAQQGKLDRESKDEILKRKGYEKVGSVLSTGNISG